MIYCVSSKFLDKNILGQEEFRTDNSRPSGGGWSNLRPIKLIFQKDMGITFPRLKSQGNSFSKIPNFCCHRAWEADGFPYKTSSGAGMNIDSSYWNWNVWKNKSHSFCSCCSSLVICTMGKNRNLLLRLMNKLKSVFCVKCLHNAQHIVRILI